MSEANIEDAILLAARLHKGQFDKAGAPYILHPLRVMLDPALTTETERITAVLHDVVEDCDITFAELHKYGYSDEVIDVIMFLTKLPEEEDNYAMFIERIRTGPELARKVKCADLNDNSDISRIAYPTDRDHKRREKYLLAIEILRSTL